tara:strand:- start:428 stop:838 length:411 start_codon:yes stop_codon:yes gene_type:complete
MINFQICGNLGADAELNEYIKNSGSESSLIEFSIYSSQYNEESGIYNMQFWCRSDKRIALILETFKKGTQVTCFGKIEQEKYKDKNGDNRTKIKFIVNQFEIPPKKEFSGINHREKPNPYKEKPDPSFGTPASLPF